jgi:hypothetical protein
MSKTPKATERRPYSFERCRPKRTASAAPWPPVAHALPNDVAAIEVGRPQAVALERDDSRAARLRRLAGPPF